MVSMQRCVSVDIPDSVVRAYVREETGKSMAVTLKGVLMKGLPRYFDPFNNFLGIKINFSVPLYFADGKQRTNMFTRYTMSLDDITWERLIKAQMYTTMSKKNIAEVVVLKELLERGDSYAENSTLHREQSIAPDD